MRTSISTLSVNVVTEYGIQKRGGLSWIGKPKTDCVSRWDAWHRLTDFSHITWQMKYELWKERTRKQQREEYDYANCGQPTYTCRRERWNTVLFKIEVKNVTWRKIKCDAVLFDDAEQIELAHIAFMRNAYKIMSKSSLGKWAFFPLGSLVERPSKHSGDTHKHFRAYKEYPSPRWRLGSSSNVQNLTHTLMRLN